MLTVSLINSDLRGIYAGIALSISKKIKLSPYLTLYTR